MNLNDFAKKVTLLEGRKINLSIAQVKEVIRIVFSLLARMPMEDIKKTLKRYY